jgi:hypothetical protein
MILKMCLCCKATGKIENGICSWCLGEKKIIPELFDLYTKLMITRKAYDSQKNSMYK